MNEMSQPTRIESTETSPAKKDWANPLPAGLVALAVACFCYFALLSGNVDASAMPLVGCWLVGGFVIQVIVGVVDLRGGNTAGGNTFVFFSAFFMLVGGLGMFAKYNGIVSGSLLDGRVDGFAWMVLAAALIMWTPAFCKPFGLLSLVVIFLDIAMPFIILNDLKLLPASMEIIPAVSLLISGLCAIYLSAATVVNTTYGRKVYPIIEKKK